MNTIPKLERTTSYDRFSPNKGQRSIDNGHVSKLVGDMKTKGFNPSKPLTVVKEGRKLALIDGHHRLEAARQAKVPVFFVTVSSNGIIPLNLLQKGWKGRDYLMHYVRKGESEYIKLYNLVERHGLGLALTTALANGSTGAGMQGGGSTSGVGGASLAFRNGTYEVKSETLVETVSQFAKTLTKIAPKLASRSLLAAFAKCTKVKGFDVDRMITGVKSNGKTKLSPHNTIDGYLEELEGVYNFHRANTIPLAFLAKKKNK